MRLNQEHTLRCNLGIVKVHVQAMMPGRRPLFFPDNQSVSQSDSQSLSQSVSQSKRVNKIHKLSEQMEWVHVKRG